MPEAAQNVEIAFNLAALRIEAEWKIVDLRGKRVSGAQTFSGGEGNQRDTRALIADGSDDRARSGRHRSKQFLQGSPGVSEIFKGAGDRDTASYIAVERKNLMRHRGSSDRDMGIRRSPAQSLEDGGCVDDAAERRFQLQEKKIANLLKIGRGDRISTAQPALDLRDSRKNRILQGLRRRRHKEPCATQGVMGFRVDSLYERRNFRCFLRYAQNDMYS